MSRLSQSFTHTALAAAVALAIPYAACAESTAKAPIHSERYYRIEQQSLADALKTFSRESGLQLFYRAELVDGLTSPALKGRYTAEEGLKRLLTDSQLVYRVKNADTITLERRPEAGLTTERLLAAAGEFVLAEAEPEEEPYTGPVEQEDLTVSGAEWNAYAIPNATAGTKTDTPIMETPLNIQVISKQVLDDQQIINLADSLKNVSGVTSFPGDIVNTALGGTPQNIIIRGFQSETFFRNGFRLQKGAGQREMANVESVEVLKGPAAVLYGLVEPGGMVNVTTKQPLATPYYAVQQQFGSYNLYRTTIDATGPLTEDDTLLYRANLSYQNSGSYRDFVDDEKVFFAPVLKWNISEHTLATLELEYNHDNLGLDVPFAPSLNGEFIKIPRSQNYGEPSNNGISETIFVGLNWSHDFNENWTIRHSFSLNQRSNDLSLLFINCRLSRISRGNPNI